MTKIIPINFVKDQISLDIVPFTDCNLNCTFCETVKNRVKFDKHRFDVYFDHIVKIINDTECKQLYFHLQGGELFMDKLADEDIQCINDFVQKIEQLCEQRSIRYTYCIISNLITKKIDRVVDFINNRRDKKIITSFDLAGRFTKQFQIDLWFNNVDYLLSQGIDIHVGMIATRAAIDIIKNKIEPHFSLFRRVYDSYPLFVSEYNNLCNIAQFATTPQDYGNFLKHLADYYPKMCQSYITVANTKSPKGNHACNKISVEFINDWIHDVCLNCTNHDYGNKLTRARNCCMCEWFGLCNMHCSDNLPIEEYCVDRDVLTYIDSKNNEKNSNL